MNITRRARVAGEAFGGVMVLPETTSGSGEIGAGVPSPSMMDS